MGWVCDSSGPYLRSFTSLGFSQNNTSHKLHEIKLEILGTTNSNKCVYWVVKKRLGKEVTAIGVCDLFGKGLIHCLRTHSQMLELTHVPQSCRALHQEENQKGLWTLLPHLSKWYLTFCRRDNSRTKGRNVRYHEVRSGAPLHRRVEPLTLLPDFFLSRVEWASSRKFSIIKPQRVLYVIMLFSVLYI